MPIGFFTASEVWKRPPDSPASFQPRILGNLSVSLVGRNLSVMTEFLCAMHQNMGDDLPDGQMAYYAKNHQSISDILAKRQSLNRFIENFCADDWTAEPDAAQERAYEYYISPSGRRSVALELTIRCITPALWNAVSADASDALWLLSDGGVYAVESDGYADFLAGILRRPSSRPVCLILSQMEKWNRFPDTGDPGLIRNLEKTMLDWCQRRFPDAEPAAVIPVEVYGGLAYAGMDAASNPVLRLNDACSAYRPRYCQIPGLYTLQTISERQGADYFSGLPEGGLTKCIQNCYFRNFGASEWKPLTLGKESV